MRNGPRGIVFHQSSAGANRKGSGKFIYTLVARLTRNPILKVPSSIRAHRVRTLLIGGQVFVFDGAAEFSREQADLPDQTRMIAALSQQIRRERES